jgi:hypothetical protein
LRCYERLSQYTRRESAFRHRYRRLNISTVRGNTSIGCLILSIGRNPQQPRLGWAILRVRGAGHSGCHRCLLLKEFRRLPIFNWGKHQCTPVLGPFYFVAVTFAHNYRHSPALTFSIPRTAHDANSRRCGCASGPLGTEGEKGAITISRVLSGAHHPADCGGHLLPIGALYREALASGRSETVIAGTAIGR